MIVMIHKATLLVSILLAPLASVSALPASTRSASHGSPTPTSSVSGLPTHTSASVSISSIPGIPHNTHTSTVGPNGEPTSIPIVGGPECWFCPSEEEDGKNGWAIWGMGDPGVYVSAEHESNDFPSPLVPITIDSIGNPSYSPTPTEKEEHQPSKRDPFAVPTQTHYLDSNRFKILSKASPKTNFKNGMGWAIKSRWPPTGTIPVPEHFQLIAGYVVTKTEDKQSKDECGDEVVKRTIQRDFDSYSYDILEATVTKDGKQYHEIRLIPRGGSSQAWANANDAKQNGYGSTAYSNLGPIKGGLTHDGLQKQGSELAKGMGQYSFWNNNCNTFVKKFYDQIKG